MFKVGDNLVNASCLQTVHDVLMQMQNVPLLPVLAVFCLLFPALLIVPYQLLQLLHMVPVMVDQLRRVFCLFLELCDLMHELLHILNAQLLQHIRYVDAILIGHVQPGIYRDAVEQLVQYLQLILLILIDVRLVDDRGDTALGKENLRRLRHQVKQILPRDRR